MKLLLLRHGAVTENLENRFIGVTDSPLIHEGERQSRLAAQNAPFVDHIYVSPLARCRRTAEIIWPTVGQTVIEQLRETDFGPFEGKNHEELSGYPLYEAWLESPDAMSALVESRTDCDGRITVAWNKVLGDARKNKFEFVAVVSHGGTLMNILYHNAFPRQDYYFWKMGNCRGFLVEAGADGTRIFVRSGFPVI